MNEIYLYVVLRPIRETPEGAKFCVLISEEGVPYDVPSFYGLELETLMSTPGFSHIFEWDYKKVNHRLPGLLGRDAKKSKGADIVGGFVEILAQGFRRIQEVDRRKIGEFFYEHVFRNEAGEKLEKAITNARAEHGELKLRLVLDGPSLNTMPWECMFYPPESKYLALLPEVTMTRYQPPTITRRKLTLPPPLRVLLVDGQQVRSERLFDLSPLVHELVRAGNNLEIELIQTSLYDLESYLFRKNYHVVQIFAHMELGTNIACLMLSEKGPDGIHNRTYRMQDLSRLFFGTSVRLLVLTPCVSSDSMWFGNLIGSRVEELGIPAVLVNQLKLSEKQIAHFAQNFYAALGEGQGVDRSVAKAQRLLALNHRGTVGAFALFLNTSDSELFDLERADLVEADDSELQEGIFSVIQQVESVKGQITGVSIDTLMESDIFDADLEENAPDEDTS